MALDIERGFVMIDKEAGLELMGGDEELFAEILADYVDESAEMIENIKKAFDEQDWKNYTVFVHGLKSASRSVGALKLGDAAYELEMAGKENNIDKIMDKHEGLLKLHSETVEYIKNDME